MTNFQYQPSLISGTFTGTGQLSPAVNFLREFSVCLGGTFNATVLIERSPDNGASWFPCSTDASGTAASYTSPVSVDVVSLVHPMLYRLHCTAFSTGTVNWTLSQ
jgi:hypothetical protein